MDIIIRKLIFILLLAVSVVMSTAQAATFEESDVKAAFIYYFFHFISWPEDGGKSSDDFIEFCSLDNGPVTQSLKQILATPKAASTKVRATLLTDPLKVSRCNYLFISAASENLARETIKNAQGKPILTVSDIENFTLWGGMIELKRTEKRVNVLINIDTLTDHQLKASSKLLNLATIVTTSGKQEQ